MPLTHRSHPYRPTQYSFKHQMLTVSQRADFRQQSMRRLLLLRYLRLTTPSRETPQCLMTRRTPLRRGRSFTRYSPGVLLVLKACIVLWLVLLIAGTLSCLALLLMLVLYCSAYIRVTTRSKSMLRTRATF